MAEKQDRNQAADMEPVTTAEQEGPDEILEEIVEKDEFQALYALIRGEEFSMKSDKP